MDIDQFRSPGGEDRVEGTYDGNSTSRPSKRSRTDTPKDKAPRKKYVKGKQGALEGIMKMPMEVFMQIAYHVHPGDLISLIRTNKFFRAMLLNQSAILIWQRALNNVPELPSCPTGMVEPQYVALMFSKHCTLCGAVATSKPDPFLRVRLCASCRDTQLGEKTLGVSNMRYHIPFSMLIKKSKKSIHKHPTYYLLPQKRELDRAENLFIQKDDKKGLAEWRLRQREAYNVQLKEGENLSKYLDSIASSRLDELKDIKAERRGQIHARLEALGWENKYFHFYSVDEDSKKQWNSLVEVSKPLTERTWTNMLPKLLQLLEGNRLRIDEFHQQQRQEERETKAVDLLSELKRNTHPYQSIVDALQLERPPDQIGSITVELEPLLSSPFPETKMIHSWDFFTSLYKEENTPERVEELFNERRGLICEKLLEWRTQVEDQLVEQYKSSINDGASFPSDTVLTLRGNADATKHIRNNARFLLRADTVFMRKVRESTTEVDREHGPIASHTHFPGIPCLRNDPECHDYSFYHGPEPEASLDQYVRHVGKETISKALLRELQMPDVSHVELEIMGKAFKCGRCDHGESMEWDALVDHYHLRRRDWIGDRFIPNTYRTRHPVIFRNLHSLDPGANPKPLVRVISSEGNTSPSHSNESVAYCLICRGVDFYEDSSFDSLVKMREHMVEVHDATEPVEGLHYHEESNWLGVIEQLMLFSQEKVEEKWDRYHDAQNPSGGAND